jgi:hypothetical protein
MYLKPRINMLSSEVLVLNKQRDKSIRDFWERLCAVGMLHIGHAKTK